MSKRRKQSRTTGEPLEPKVEHIPGRDFAGASWAADEQEQTEDLRNRDPVGEADVSMGGVSPDLENKFADDT
jgi:hypothetical protein